MRRTTAILATALLASLPSPAGRLADGPDGRQLAVELAVRRAGALGFRATGAPARALA